MSAASSHRQATIRSGRRCRGSQTDPPSGQSEWQSSSAMHAAHVDTSNALNSSNVRACDPTRSRCRCPSRTHERARLQKQDDVSDSGSLRLRTACAAENNKRCDRPRKHRALCGLCSRALRQNRMTLSTTARNQPSPHIWKATNRVKEATALVAALASTPTPRQVLQKWHFGCVALSCRGAI